MLSTEIPVTRDPLDTASTYSLYFRAASTAIPAAATSPAPIKADVAMRAPFTVPRSPTNFSAHASNSPPRSLRSFPIKLRKRRILLSASSVFAPMLNKSSALESIAIFSPYPVTPQQTRKHHGLKPCLVNPGEVIFLRIPPDEPRDGNLAQPPVRSGFQQPIPNPLIQLIGSHAEARRQAVC